jgi:hypothetical protein
MPKDCRTDHVVDDNIARISDLKPLNEDELGIIVDEDHHFNSIEEAGNYVSGLKDKLKRKAGMEEFPVTTATPAEQKRYLQYGISLMTRKNLPFTDQVRMRRARAVLYLRSEGYTFNAIIAWLRHNGFPSAKLSDLARVEKEGKEMVKDAIAHVKGTGTPLLWGPR